MIGESGDDGQRREQEGSSMIGESGDDGQRREQEGSSMIEEWRRRAAQRSRGQLDAWGVATTGSADCNRRTAR
jgi:hypothetical protein